MKTIILIVLFLFVIPICFLASSKKKDEKSKAEKQKAAEEKRRQLEEAERQKQAEREAKEAERTEWERQHGRFTTAIAGVTFDNEDGTSRQKILKDLKIRGTAGAALRLEEFEYKGSPAVRVIVDDMCIGNIPKNRVGELLNIMDKLEKANLEIDTFYPEAEEDEDGKTVRRGPCVYRADIYLIYSKL